MNDKIDAIKAFEIIAELQALQTKLQSLEAYCEEQIENKTYDTDWLNGKVSAYQDILDKLRS